MKLSLLRSRAKCNTVTLLNKRRLSPDIFYYEKGPRGTSANGHCRKRTLFHGFNDRRIQQPRLSEHLYVDTLRLIPMVCVHVLLNKTNIFLITKVFSFHSRKDKILIMIIT